jgi:hypothetical protein
MTLEEAVLSWIRSDQAMEMLCDEAMKYSDSAWHEFGFQVAHESMPQDLREAFNFWGSPWHPDAHKAWNQLREITISCCSCGKDLPVVSSLRIYNAAFCISCYSSKGKDSL